jgi:hypothetical protein
MTLRVKELLSGIYCLAELSKDVDGEVLVLDADQRTCQTPGCDSLTLVTNLRLNLHSARCDSTLSMVLDGLIRSWNLTTVFAGRSEVLRGVHEGDLYWSSSGGGTIRGTLEGITNAGIVRLAVFSDCEPCDQVGALTGHLFATGTNISGIPVPEFNIEAVYRLVWDPTATIHRTAPVKGTIEGAILMPCQ